MSKLFELLCKLESKFEVYLTARHYAIQGCDQFLRFRKIGTTMIVTMIKLINVRPSVEPISDWSSAGWGVVVI